MRIALLGGTGRLGQCIIEEGVRRGYRISVLARNPEAIPELDLVDSFAGDVESNVGLTETIFGCDVVISALGVGLDRGPTRIYSRGIENILSVMQDVGVHRLITVSAAPAGPWSDVGWVERRVVYPILERAFGNCYEDMRRMESVLREAECAWTVFRPPRLTQGSARGETRQSLEGPLSSAIWLSRANLAFAMYEVIENSSSHRRFISVAR